MKNFKHGIETSYLHQMFLVKRWMTLNSLKNTLPITRITVYNGMANTIPKMPPNFAPIKTIKNISSGCALTLFEKILGCKMKLSISCTIPKTIKTLILTWILTTRVFLSILFSKLILKPKKKKEYITSTIITT